MQSGLVNLREVARSDAKRALAEDLGFEVDRWPDDLSALDLSGSLLVKETSARAEIITRDNGIFCGREWGLAVCQLVGRSIECEFLQGDGAPIEPNDVIAVLKGTPAELVTVERTLLNFLQFMSGIATKARTYADAVANTDARVFDTRKTIPGLRIAQKYAVACGGCANHRMGLFDAYLLKENHLIAMGGIEAALPELDRRSPDHQVQVEVESLDELEAAIAAGARLIMLDNFSLAETREAVHRASGRAELEASGNVTIKSIGALAETGVNRISVGELTKAIDPLDLSMRFVGTQ